MATILQAAIGLTGLMCSAALTLGLVSPALDPSSLELLEPVMPESIQAMLPVETGSTPNHYSQTAQRIARNAPAPTESEYAPVALQPRPGESTAVERVYRVCRVTAYCDRGTTASGVRSGVGQCAAPGDIPFGAIVRIPALGRSFVVTDRTHRRFRRSTVDLFIPSQRECRRFGRQYLECEIIIPESVSRAPRR